MRNSMGLDLVIRPKGRSPADEYQHRGQTWIEGRNGSNYVIELQNHTWNRVMAVVSVDGLCVIDGKPASYDSDGFLVEANGTLSIPGWMLNHQQAAEFVFGSRQTSYAAQSGNDVSNVGVIGVAWFAELGPTLPIQPLPFYGVGLDTASKGLVGARGLSASGSIGSVGSNSAVTASVGTGFGNETSFQTTLSGFVRQSNQPMVVQTIFYDSADNLQKMGIRLKERSTYSSRVAFPGSETGFCKPPPTWVQKASK
jgi:hypothetical protein